MLSFTATVLHTYLEFTCPFASSLLHVPWGCLEGHSVPLPGGLLLLGVPPSQDTRWQEQRALYCLLLSLGAQHGGEALVAVTRVCSLCIILCTALIAHCFWRICLEPRVSGPSRQGFSQAKERLIIHMVLITLYLSTGLKFSLNIMLTKRQHFGARTLLAANGKVLTMLPRALLPYLYMLCYHQMLGMPQGCCSSRWPKVICTIPRRYWGQSGCPRLKSRLLCSLIVHPTKSHCRSFAVTWMDGF